MTVSLLMGILGPPFIVGLALAQVSAPNCTAATDSSVAWSLNSLGQGPCLVGAYLAAMCNYGAFMIPALSAQHSYTGPSGPDNDDLCKCNTVLYNLISACDACQGEAWIPYSSWTANCSRNVTPGIFPASIPKGTRVPRWAYLDPTSDDSWNLTVARSAGDSPEVTGSVFIVPTSTKNSPTQPTIRPQTTSPVSSSSPNIGKIAGGVVSGIVGAALIAGVILWFIIHRWRARSALTAVYTDGQDGSSQTAVPYPVTVEIPRPYDPSDPSTYPTWISSLLTRVKTTNYGGQSVPHYSGLPEV